MLERTNHEITPVAFRKRTTDTVQATASFPPPLPFSLLPSSKQREGRGEDACVCVEDFEYSTISPRSGRGVKQSTVSACFPSHQHSEPQLHVRYIRIERGPISTKYPITRKEGRDIIIRSTVLLQPRERNTSCSRGLTATGRARTLHVSSRPH